MSVTRVDKNKTHRIWATFVDASGAFLTGLSPTLRIMRADGNFLDKDDGSFGATPDDATMTEADATNLAGKYYYDWAVPDAWAEYTVRADGGATAGNRYQEGEIHSVVLADTVAGNSRSQDIDSGVVSYKDGDGTTVLHTLAPGNDDATAPTENTWTAA